MAPMADRQTRERVTRFADAHGPRAAARHFGVPLGTVKGWQGRARQQQAKRDGLTPTERRQLAALLLVQWTERGVCYRCAGVGEITVPPVERAGLRIRGQRRLPCPTCGGGVRRGRVVEWPRREWEQQMVLAAELGAGWLPWEWERIRAGEHYPAGYRLPDGDRLEPGQ
jgi:hypothetical protein